MPVTGLTIALVVAIAVAISLFLHNSDLRSRFDQQLQLYGALQSRVSEEVREQVAAWRARELESVRAELWKAAQAQARVDLGQWRLEHEAAIRADAIQRSSSVVSGKVTEHIAPYLPSFPYNPRDARFLGAPIDLIVFDGLDEEDLREIVFLEVKTGNSTLNTRERRVRDAILEKRVAWKEFRVSLGAG
jgi:predicted Holliday junction resolvase-like endonuclease